MSFFNRMVFFLVFIFFTRFISAQCGVTDTIIPILDNEKPMEFQLIVDGFTNNDLSNPSQGVCGVTLKYNHTKRSELTIDLISPAGQKVALVGPYVQDNSLYGTILWDISFVRCVDLAGPDDANKDQHFNSTNDWFSITGGYTGVYYPHDYCLEDFNLGPVNGTWTFVVHDHSHFQKGNLLGFTIEFCDGSTNECNMCNAYAGVFSNTDVQYCQDVGNITIDLDHSFANKEPNSDFYNYEYVVSKNNAIIEHSTLPNLDLREAGEYHICGLSYHKLDSANVISLINSSAFDVMYDSLEFIGSPYCADLTDTCITVIVNPVDTIRIDSVICFGDTIIFKNKKLFSSGKYYFESNANCDPAYIINLDVVKLNAAIDAPETTLHCKGELYLTGLGFVPDSNMSFRWSTTSATSTTDTTKVIIGKPGTYSFILTEGYCSDTATVTIDADDDVPILDFVIPEINCENDTVMLSVSSSNTTLDTISWYNGVYYSGQDIFTSKPGGYFVFCISDKGCNAFEIIDVPIDTTPPTVSLYANDITCDADTSFISLTTNSELREVFWEELGVNEKNVFVLDSGMYHVRLIGENGCENIDSIYVNSYKQDVDYTISSDTITCIQSTVLIDFSTVEDSLDFLWITPRGDSLYSEDIDADTSGIYNFYITNKYGCLTIGQYEVYDNMNEPQINFIDDTLFLSCGVPVHLNPEIDSDYISVFWGGPGNFHSSILDPVVNFEGTYYINVIGKNGCTNRDSVFVKYDNSVPNISILTDTITCTDSIPFLHVSYSGNYSFKWEDPFNLTYFGSSMKGLKNVGGFYYLTVIDNASGCESEFYTYVPIDTIIPSFEFVYSNLLDCSNDSLVLKYKTNYDANKFYWSNGSINNYLDSIVVYDEGMIYGQLISKSGCYYKDSIFIKKEDHIDIGSDTFYLTCRNDLKAVLSIKNPKQDYTYSWSGNGFVSQSPSPTVDEEGMYKVVVQSADCLDSSIFLVLYDTLRPKYTITYDSVITCEHNFANIKAQILTPGIETYYWDGPNFHSGDLDVIVYEEGQYFFTASTSNGCEVFDTVNIKKSEHFPKVNAKGDTINCLISNHTFKISAKITGGYNSAYWVGPNGYESYTLENEVSDTGKYTIYVRNEEGCLSVDSAYVVYDTALPIVQVADIDVLTCYNDTVIIAPNISAKNYQVEWKGPYGFESSNEVINITNGGDYILRVEPENGCVRKDTFKVFVDKLHPMLIIDGENLNCCTSKKTIKLSTTAKSFNQKWIFPDDSISTNQNIVVADEGVYKVEVIDLNNGCISRDSIFIKWDSLKPKIIIQDYFLNCDTSNIEMIAYSDEPDVKYKWYGPGFYKEGSKVYTNAAGNYYIVAEGNNCCVSTKTFDVKEKHVNPLFNVVGSNLNCKKDSVQLKAIGVEDDFSLEWTGPNGFISNIKNPYVYEPGDYKIKVVGQNKCDSTAQVRVESDTVEPILELKYLDSLICDKEEGKIDAEILNKEDLLYSYSWSTNKGSISSGKYSKSLVFKGAGTYIVEVTNTNNGCKSHDTLAISGYSYNLDSAKINIKPPSCYGYSDAIIEIDTIYGGKKPYRYSLDNYWFSNNKSYNSKSSGVYNIYIKDVYGCILDTNIVVPDGSDVQLQLGVDKNNIFQGDSVTIRALIVANNGIASYQWKPDFLFDNQQDSVQVVKPTKSNNIILTVIDSNGCSAEDVIWINVKGEPDVYLPNIFTPNNDGLNDYFYMKSGSGVKKINRLMIFDNWGDKLFDKVNLRKNVPNDGWDGMYNGKEVGLGVYVYVFELELEDGSIKRIAGDITIVK